ncbi:hypothetical protein [Stakelama tenebrarum]|uniref:Uncharacterized protein n=1 Tax=Stakelama tenebrarum TaxID=2711215 RepID=A0A6G6Y2W2_9SPHN|nr:hypothetical protein [Sphingosinithalassobacter tenebrarum]QIG79239.1 hypothetical protein G5C33_05150 [Sphingosinithalassobacter tenebrarum]
MTSFTPPEIDLGGVVQALMVWAITPQAIVIGALVGLLGKRWYDAFWAFPILIAHQLISQPAFRETLLSNPANLLIGLAPLPWALIILIVKQVRARSH